MVRGRVLSTPLRSLLEHLAFALLLAVGFFGP